MTATPETLVALCASDQLAEGEGRRVTPADLPPIALFRSGGTLYAIDDTCTHGQASLAEGWLEGDEIECPVHQGRFCLRTGRPLCFPVTAPVRTHAVREIDGTIYLDRATSGD